MRRPLQQLWGEPCLALLLFICVGTFMKREYKNPSTGEKGKEHEKGMDADNASLSGVSE